MALEQGWRALFLLTALVQLSDALTLSVNQQRPAVGIAYLDDSSELDDAHTRNLFDAGSSNITFNHFPKAGGTFIKSILFASLQDAGVNLKIEKEYEDMHGTESDRFVIANVRNPCDYYLSSWAYNNKRGGMPRVYKPVTPTADSPEDIQHFRYWFKRIVSSYNGFESFRFALKYCNDDGALLSSDYFRAPQTLTDDFKTLMDSKLDNCDLSRVCWVKTESLVDDLRGCLHKYEKAAGSVVNWEKFEAAASDASKHHSTEHAPCKEFFDAETESTVRRTMDRHLFKKFGYENCCAPQ